MFLNYVGLGEEYTKVFYYNFKKNSKGIKITLVGEQEVNMVKVLTYSAYQVEVKDEKLKADILVFLNRGFSIIKEKRGGVLDISLITRVYKVKVQKANSILAKNLLLTYNRAETINGYMATEDTLLALTGYTYVADHYNLFIADLKVAEVSHTPTELDAHERVKWENASFENGNALYDLVKAAYHYGQVRRRIMGERYDNKDYLFELEFEEWLTTKMGKEEKKLLKKMNKKELKKAKSI